MDYTAAVLLDSTCHRRKVSGYPRTEHPRQAKSFPLNSTTIASQSSCDGAPGHIGCGFNCVPIMKDERLRNSNWKSKYIRASS
jgi:hypothetical protein